MLMSAKPYSLADLDATRRKVSLSTLCGRVRTQDLKIIKHGAAQAVVISLERYEAFLRLEPIALTALERLQGEFDAMIESMQTPSQSGAMERLMKAPEVELNAFLTRHYDARPLPFIATSPKRQAGGVVDRRKSARAPTRMKSLHAKVASKKASTTSAGKGPKSAKSALKSNGVRGH